MSWHFSQALEAEFSAENCSDGERFALWNSLPSVPDDSRSAKMKDTFHRSPFGTMFVPSTDALGMELLTWFRAGFHARTFPAPEKVLELMAPALVYGPKWRGLSVKLDPNGCWSKIRPSLLPEDSEPFCGTWPKWGSMRNGECWERLTPERPTNGKESGLLPTIRATDGERGGRGDLIQAVRGNENSHFRLWPTATANCSTGAGTRETRRDESSNGCKSISDSELQGLEGLWTDARETEISKSWNRGIVSQSDFGTISESNGTASSARWWAAEPRLGRVAHGVAHRVDRLRAIGNGQVPAVAAMAFRILFGRLLNAP